jgi:hypothetical protein
MTMIDILWAKVKSQKILIPMHFGVYHKLLEGHLQIPICQYLMKMVMHMPRADFLVVNHLITLMGSLGLFTVWVANEFDMSSASKSSQWTATA